MNIAGLLLVVLTLLTIPVAARSEGEAPGPTVPYLAVYPRREHLPTYSAPGVTVFVIETNATYRVKLLARSGAKTVFRGRVKTIKLDRPAREYGQIGIKWPSCKHPEATYRYVITTETESEDGPLITWTGQSKGPSRWWCSRVRREERRVRRLDESDRRRLRAEEEAARQRERRRERERAHHERERFEHNCRAIGGIPVEIELRSGKETVCRSKTGGIIPVPT